MSIVVSTLLGDALAELRSARAGDVIGPDDQDMALRVLNRLFDALNANGRALYSTSFATFVLTPNLQPHTIGIAANAPTLTVSVGRPVDILAANLVIGSGASRRPLTLRDRQWWANVRARLITSADPTDLYYEPGWPNGAIYLWPVATANSLELNTRTLIAAVAAADTLDMPMGYEEALELLLAKRLAAKFGQSWSSTQQERLQEAVGIVWGNNDEVPDLVTRDGGMPGVSGGRFDYRTGFCE